MAYSHGVYLMARKKRVEPSSDALQDDYNQVKPKSEKFMAALCEQIENLLSTQHITLGVPLECRVKSLESISQNIERNKLSIGSVIEIDDLIGIRLILLFRRDVDIIHEIIMKTFDIIRYEDAGTRLTETQFGYQSVHYIIKIPKSWLKVPSLHDFIAFKAEVQVRTLAQHIWAATSHVLQYKQEASVPLPIMRSIYRVSAILETVDLEYERLLVERESYITKVDISQEDIRLNVDLVQRILDELLPAENKGSSEPYSFLIEDLLFFDIDNVGKLRQLIQSNLSKVLKEDKLVVKNRLKGKVNITERIKRGVFFIHVGLARQSMQEQFGNKWFEYIIRNPKYKSSSST